MQDYFTSRGKAVPCRHWGSCKTTSGEQEIHPTISTRILRADGESGNPNMMQTSYLVSPSTPPPSFPPPLFPPPPRNQSQRSLAPPFAVWRLSVAPARGFVPASGGKAAAVEWFRSFSFSSSFCINSSNAIKSNLSGSVGLRLGFDAAGRSP